MSTFSGLWNYFLIKKENLSKYPITFGAWIGSSAVLSFVYLTSGIYWAALSNCDEEPPNVDLNQYDCSKTGAMVTMCLFAFLLTACEIIILCNLNQAKKEIMVNYRQSESDEENKTNEPWWSAVDNNNMSEPLLD